MRAVIACLVLPAFSACSGSGAGLSEGVPITGPDCFPAPVIASYDAVDSDTIRIKVGPDESYDVDLSGPDCGNISWTYRAAFTGMSSWICVGETVGRETLTFHDPSTNRPVQCRVEAVRRVEARPQS
jgi:hypothetical protein